MHKRPWPPAPGCIIACMLTTLVLGAASSLAAELITWLNKKLSGTVLKGDAAWILAAAVSIIAACAKVFWLDGGIPADLPTFLTDLATIWAISQVFFLWVVQRFDIDVSSS